jgi:hypothetical protein
MWTYSGHWIVRIDDTNTAIIRRPQGGVPSTPNRRISSIKIEYSNTWPPWITSRNRALSCTATKRHYVRVAKRTKDQSVFWIVTNETLTSLNKETHSFSVKEVTENSGRWRISGQVWSLSRSSVVFRAVSAVETTRFVLTQNLPGRSASVLTRSATGTDGGDPWFMM